MEPSITKKIEEDKNKLYLNLINDVKMLQQIEKYNFNEVIKKPFTINEKLSLLQIDINYSILHLNNFNKQIDLIIYGEHTK